VRASHLYICVSFLCDARFAVRFFLVLFRIWKSF